MKVECGSKYNNWKTEKELVSLTRIRAALLWCKRGCRKDCNVARMNNDWYDAKREVAFLLADEIIELCKVDTIFTIPAYYYSYLHNISLNEYKQRKVRLSWANRSAKNTNNKFNHYRLVGNELNNIFLSSRYKNTPLAAFDEYIKGALSVKENIKKRKAFWLNTIYRKDESRACWEEAAGFVDTCYHGLSEIIRKGTAQEFSGLKNSAVDKMHMLNMMEFFIFSFSFVTRLSSPKMMIA